PQEAVAPVGHQEGDRDFRVALVQLDYAPLLIEPPVLVLPQPIEALAVLRAEPRFDLEQATVAGLEVAAGRHVVGRDRALLKQRLTRRRVGEAQPAAARDRRPD